MRGYWCASHTAGVSLSAGKLALWDVQSALLVVSDDGDASKATPATKGVCGSRVNVARSCLLLHPRSYAGGSHSRLDNLRFFGWACCCAPESTGFFHNGRDVGPMCPDGGQVKRCVVVEESRIGLSAGVAQA
jgi:hypothetical protein